MARIGGYSTCQRPEMAGTRKEMNSDVSAMWASDRHSDRKALSPALRARRSERSRAERSASLDGRGGRPKRPARASESLSWWNCEKRLVTVVDASPAVTLRM
jgi:hypothetical protein